MKAVAGQQRADVLPLPVTVEDAVPQGGGERDPGGEGHGVERVRALARGGLGHRPHTLAAGVG